MSQPDQYLEKIRKILSDQVEIKYATVFGSLAKDRLTTESDIDIAVAGEKPLSVEFLVRLIDTLNADLAIPVDLIDLQTVSGSILQQALCTGITVKKTSTLLLSSLIKKMWYNQADMMPNVLMSQKKHSARFLDG